MIKKYICVIFMAVATAIFFLAGAGCIRLASSALELDAPSMDLMMTERNIMVPMRDGTRLATDVYRPATPGRYPVVLTRIPYGSDPGDGLPWGQLQVLGKMFVKHGYIYVVQDTRGEFDSEGEWFPFVFEHDDGQDTIAWIADQQWCDGKIGMWGGSYFGYTQLIAAPQTPELDAMVPLVASGNLHDLVFRGGASAFISMRGWVAEEANSQLRRQGKRPDHKLDLSGGYYNAPLRDAEPIDEETWRNDPDAMKDGPWRLLAHPGDTEHVPAMNYEGYYRDVSAPALLIAGWYDIFIAAQLDDFNRLRSEGQGHARASRLVVGPWVHGQVWSDFEEDKLSGPRLVANLFFDWYEYWLKGKDNGVAEAAPISIFVMGENAWRDEYEWPLARTRYVDYFVHGGGNANSSSGDGRLGVTPPGDEPPDTYLYDPADPVPTVGGAFLEALDFEAGPLDQAEVEKRGDVLVYVSDPLEGPLEVTGPITVTLYAASSAVDTDWTAKLVDLGPDGFARIVQNGIIRARYREGYQRPSHIVPGQVYEYKIDLWATSNLFLAGHRIVLEISSSNFPQFDRNTNGGGEGGPDTIVTARQTVHHDAERPTRITLPIIPR